jgi:hypothetical protein
MDNKFLEINSIDPKYWGKSGWIFINSIALTYEPSKKENYRQFILQLPEILPCKTCGENLRKNIDTLDEALETKEDFIRWLINVRNGIYSDNNTDWKHKDLKNTFDEIFYSHTTKINTYLWMFICVLIVIMLIYLLKKEIDKFN